MATVALTQWCQLSCPRGAAIVHAGPKPVLEAGVCVAAYNHGEAGGTQHRSANRSGSSCTLARGMCCLSPPPLLPQP
eukprot:7231484-Alexandrium_andersonii.AAC.1